MEKETITTEENTTEENTTSRKLTKPVMAHGERIHVIDLKEPNGSHVRRLGYPFTLNKDFQIVLIGDVVARYISELGEVPPSTVDSMAPSDLYQLGLSVAYFFLEG